MKQKTNQLSLDLNLSPEPRKIYHYKGWTIELIRTYPEETFDYSSSLDSKQYWRYRRSVEQISSTIYKKGHRLSGSLIMREPEKEELVLQATKNYIDTFKLGEE
jgi:hypothetical protein